MTLWRKQAVGYCQHPKVVAAGPDAALVFLVLLDLNTELARDGELLDRDVVECVVAGRCPMLPLRRVRAGMAACATHGLVERTKGGLRIVGWDDRWRPRRAEPTTDLVEVSDGPVCTRCRTRAPEPGLKRCAQCNWYDAERRNGAQTADRTAESAVRTAAEPQRNRSAHRSENRSGAAAATAVRTAAEPQIQNGTRYQSGCSERGEETRPEQTRANDDADARLSGLKGSGDRGVSVALDARARAPEHALGERSEGETDPNIARIVRGLAQKVTGEEP